MCYKLYNSLLLFLLYIDSNFFKELRKSKKQLSFVITYIFTTSGLFILLHRSIISGCLKLFSEMFWRTVYLQGLKVSCSRLVINDKRENVLLKWRFFFGHHHNKQD